MKYAIIILVQIILLLSAISSNAQKVSNVHFEQVEEKIHIYYDLETEESCTVFLFFKKNISHNWGKPLEHISGDMGIGQTNGKNKMIVWDVLKDRTNIIGNIHFKIDAFHESGMRLYNDMIPHPSYFVTCFVVDSEQEAKEKVYLLKIQGLKAHYYWIPDIIKNGKSFFEVIIGPFEHKSDCKQSHITVKNKFRDNAYIIRVE
jgi:hypothetical protein